MVSGKAAVPGRAPWCSSTIENALVSPAAVVSCLPSAKDPTTGSPTPPCVVPETAAFAFPAAVVAMSVPTVASAPPAMHRVTPSTRTTAMAAAAGAFWRTPRQDMPAESATSAPEPVTFMM